MLFTMLEPTVAPAPKIAIILVRSSRRELFLREIHTSITQLLAELLSTLLKLALLRRVMGGIRGRSALADIQRHVPVVGARRGRNRCRSLLIDHIYVASGEDTFHTSSLIATTPPWKYRLAQAPWFIARPEHTVVVHVLNDLNAVIRLQCQVARIRGCVCIQRRGEREDGRDLRVGWRRLGRRGDISIVERGFLIEGGVGHLSCRRRVWCRGRLRLHGHRFWQG